MGDHPDFYERNPVSILDQNTWDDRLAEVEMQFLEQPSIYTHLITWDDRSQVTGAQTSIYTDLLASDTNADPIGMNDLYIEQPIGIDSRERRMTVLRYANKVQLNSQSNIFQQWQLPNNQRTWEPLLRGILGNNIRETFEMISRNAFLKGPKEFWTFGGTATDFSGLNNTSTFSLSIVKAWNLRIGQTGVPVIPGDKVNAKVAVMPPGCYYDFLASLSDSDATMWQTSREYGADAVNLELGTWNGVRFIGAPNNAYGENPAILYNAGSIIKQFAVKAPISRGDGAPDPSTTAVDGAWYTGQKSKTHYIQLDTFVAGDFSLNDLVSIHTMRTSEYGVTDGVDPLSGETITRRVVAIDEANSRLSFDRPIMYDYDEDLGGTVYAYVTKGVHVGMILVIGSADGVRGNVNSPVSFAEPAPVDDFNRVWRFSWDFIGGTNIWEPHMFEVHFVAVSVPKPGGIISPPAP